jgi:two-component system, NtrC family, sensor kinase
MEKGLREREQWLTTTMRSIGDAIVSTDAVGRINYMNPVAEALTGWKMEKAHGRPAGDILHLVQDDGLRTPMANPLQMALDEERTLNVDGVLVRTEAQDRFISDNTAPIVGEDGKVLGAVMVFRDVGERRQLQRQLEMADRLATIGTMVAGVAHEVNNPLSFILANVGFALEALQRRRSAPLVDADDDWMAEIEAALLDAQTGTHRVGKIAADLTVFTRGAADPQGRTNLNEVLNWSIEVAGHTLRERGHVVRCLGDVPAVDAASGRLGQVFVNLLINAAYALDPERTQTNQVVVTTRTDPEGRAVVEIRDTGDGMTPEVLKKIFEPVFTTKPVGEGTGLGLSVSHGIVASLGGTIAFESELGKGTVARIVLPCSRSDAAQ